MSAPSYDDYTVDELIAASEALDDRGDGLSDRLGRITGRAGNDEHGIEVTVNFGGKLIGLELANMALRLGPDGLAAEILRLVTQASDAALADGTALLREVTGDELTGLVDLGDSADVPERPTATEYPVESWALPH